MIDEETRKKLIEHHTTHKQKPIYKFNNGFGATLCHNCGVIINEGFSDKLYCNECRKDDTS